MTWTFRQVEYDEVEPLRKVAAREGVLLRQGKTPITWFAGYDGSEMFGVIGLLRVTSSRARVRGRWVLPAHRGQGYGHFLLMELLDYARAAGYTVVERTTKRWQIGVSEGWRLVKSYSDAIGSTIELTL